MVIPARQDGEADGEAAIPTQADAALVKVLVRAFRYQRLLDEGTYASISEMAAAERIEWSYLGSLLRLMLLSPDIVEAILDGRQPEGVNLPVLMMSLPAGWEMRIAVFPELRPKHGLVSRWPPRQNR